MSNPRISCLGRATRSGLPILALRPRRPVHLHRYMAPEQIRGTPLMTSDQYALAVMVYEWLCGAPPFSGSEIVVCVQHVSAPPPRLRERVPSISRAVEHVVLKALEKDPRQRFAHVLEFASAFKKASLEQR